MNIRPDHVNDAIEIIFIIFFNSFFFFFFFTSNCQFVFEWAAPYIYCACIRVCSMFIYQKSSMSWGWKTKSILIWSSMLIHIPHLSTFLRCFFFHSRHKIHHRYYVNSVVLKIVATQTESQIDQRRKSSNTLPFYHSFVRSCAGAEYIRDGARLWSDTEKKRKEKNHNSIKPRKIEIRCSSFNVNCTGLHV